MTISVVIPAHNEEAYIAACIESVLAHVTADVLEIVVVCNACTDRTAEIAAGYPGVRVVREPRQGTGFARQRGADETTGELIAFLDADTRIHAQWFPMAFAAFAADASLVSLTGPYRFYDLPPLSNAFMRAWFPVVKLNAYRYYGFTVIGGNFVVRRSALRQIGGFDTSISFWGDDTNVARRLHDVGTVKFVMEFFNYTSGRRLKTQGFLRAGMHYTLNNLSQAHFQKTLTRNSGGRPWETRTGAGSTRP